VWLPPIKNLQIPNKDAPGAFGAIRKFDIHTGVDLYCTEGTLVYAVEDGTVVQYGPFTGPKVGSPWWLDTDFIMIEGSSGVVCYGEIELREDLKIGSRINAGDIIGTVKRVLINDKGFPTTMLHLELYKQGTRVPVVWSHFEEKPECLLDPTYLL
jgi:murein DD-endopeptidase MepM/ murein hydrolase activator NlpD